jgi:hypothetical protein
MNNILTNLAIGVCIGLALLAMYGLTRLARRIAWWLVAERDERTH